MPKTRRLVREAAFSLGRGQSLIVSIAMLGTGLDRVLVERDRRGSVRVHAINGPGGGRFEFDDVKRGPSACDFWIARTDSRTSIADILRSLFWSQFTYGELSELRRNGQLQGKLTHAVRSLADDMERTAARRLNSMVKLGRFRPRQGRRSG